MSKLIFSWIPPILWMILIFTFSSRQKVAVTHEYASDFTIFKTLHIIEYAILCALFFRAIYKTSKKSIPEMLAWAFILSLSYAFIDEYHQTFVPTRDGTFRDIFIDLIGITGMSFYINYNLDKLKRFL
ncbi:hypothetical protein A3C24_04480 [Candidatus Roizmanbacteria bacterium RIFCSPHIGHO2_02_FULL_37_24]|uniref:VanZ-like domain-containing protein n=1 Tax=Candidatus Roizmanbacteria bacterium RIFCSPHIGHO2_02_FULL_37_24 TaxID=1802037 RepID=A0A1F7GV82_9BACT|nr:MAG: hypothetical protein A3C24_04480 [Candidatus Roizmanbacteria bacterium RIFCSPHIGHO2_02_FULL_37_24]